VNCIEVSEDRIRKLDCDKPYSRVSTATAVGLPLFSEYRVPYC